MTLEWPFGVSCSYARQPRTSRRCAPLGPNRVTRASRTVSRTTEERTDSRARASAVKNGKSDCEAKDFAVKKDFVVPTLAPRICESDHREESKDRLWRTFRPQCLRSMVDFVLGVADTKFLDRRSCDDRCPFLIARSLRRFERLKETAEGD